MNRILVAFLVLAVSLVAAQDYKALVAEITQKCATKHSIPPEQIGVLRATKNKNDIQASENLKCFAKCAILASNFIEPGTGIVAERVVAVGVANGKDETQLRNGVEKCQSVYTGSESCEEYWNLYVCINSQ